LQVSISEATIDHLLGELGCAGKTVNEQRLLAQGLQVVAGQVGFARFDVRLSLVDHRRLQKLLPFDSFNRCLGGGGICLGQLELGAVVVVDNLNQ
jgi:hypothetical protein